MLLCYEALIHSVVIVGIVELAQHFLLAALAHDGDGWMLNAVEGTRLHCGIVNHVLEDDGFPHLEFVVETPEAHEVATETRIAAKAVGARLSAHLTIAFCIVSVHLDCLRTAHLWPVRHFEAVRHVTGETYVEDGGANAMVLHDVHHFAY